jgi:S-adenosylmethionine decarboxylase
MTATAPTSHEPGQHILADFWGVEAHYTITEIDRALRDAAKAGGATVLDVSLHTFGKSSGITGVAILAESHISIHTWPEHKFVALDVFMCGTGKPQNALYSLRHFFRPKRQKTSVHRRGGL